MINYEPTPGLLLQGVLERAMADPMGPLTSIPALMETDDPLIRGELVEQLLRIPPWYVARAQDDPLFRGLYGDAGGEVADRLARMWVLIALLDVAVPRRRLSALQAESNPSRHALSDAPALRDLLVTAEGLVPLRAFEVIGGTLYRGGYAFMVVPTIDAQNASHWLTLALMEHAAAAAFVRLDPFMLGPANDFSAPVYKIWWHGKPLDWNRIRSLRTVDHGRWWSQDRRGERITEFAWDPRDGEVHFTCEELPLEVELAERGGRYLHAVYDSEAESITHLDGAIRVYSKEELARRVGSHLRGAGKCGIRLKVFRVDGELSREALSDITTTFFMWNWDVRNYFLGAGGPTAEPQPAR